jgi:hypothetical protein
MPTVQDVRSALADAIAVTGLRIGEVTASSQGESNYLAVPLDVEVVF